MERIQADEGFVRRRGIVITQLGEIELTEIAVDAVLVGALAVRREVLADDFGSAEIREAQADDAERVGDAALIAFFMSRIEVVADRHLVIEQRDVLVQRLVVELLFVERPSELVQRELVVVRACSQGDDRRVRALRIAEFSAREEVLGATELHFVDVSGAGIRSDQPLHRPHRIFGASQLVVRAGL